MSLLKFILARPLIALLLAGAVVAFLFFHAERQSTPVTHRTQRVALSDEQQMQLGAQDYAKTLAKERANIVSSGAQYEMVQRVAKGAPLPRKVECEEAATYDCESLGLWIIDSSNAHRKLIHSFGDAGGDIPALDWRSSP